MVGEMPTSATAESLSRMEQGIFEARSGRLDAAIDLWTRAIRRNSKSYAAHVNRGTAYMRSGHVLKAVIDWHRAKELSPVFAYSLYCADYIFEASENPSMLNFAVTVELEPDHVASVSMLGSTLLDLGQNARAAELFRKSVDLTTNELLKARLEYWADSIGSE
jgi:tetratricopeptide (TPR) repeat protein